MDSDNPERPSEAPGAEPGRPEGQGPFGGAQLQFPVSFDLRIIYVLAQGATIVEDLERIYASLRVRCTLIQGIAAPGAKYGRMGSRITLESREQMHAVYAAIAKLPYVKTAI